MNGYISRSSRIISLGACAVCAQTLLMRELLGIVTGTELVLGLALASWLLWTAAGGLLGGRAMRGGSGLAGRAFPGLSAAVALSLPLIVLAVRALRGVLVDPPGSMPAPLPASLFIATASAPFGLLYGALYNCASEVLAGSGGVRRGITPAYVREASGSVAGGILLSVVLLKYLTQVEAAFLVSALVTFVFLVTSEKGRRAGWAVAFTAAAGGVIASPGLDRGSMALVFGGYELREIVPSRYSELCVTRVRETVSVFSGGARVLTVPDAEAEGERAHVPLLAHPAPRKVLYIGEGISGVAGEALNHPGVETVEWTELDESVSSIVREVKGGRFPPSGAKSIRGDGRSVLNSHGPWDVIAVDVPEPVSLRWNRYFTSEFLAAAAGALADGGVLTLRHSSSENFVSERNADVLGIIRETLLNSFEEVVVVPGGTVFFIASQDPVDPETIPSRCTERGLQGRFLSIDALPYRITGERIDHLSGALAKAQSRVNTDMYPALVPYELLLHSWKSGVYAGGLADRVVRAPRWLTPALLMILALAAMALSGRRGAARCAVFMTGMSCMTVQVAVMLALQIFSGLLYLMLALLTALFMAGAAAGAAAGGPGLKSLHILMAASALLVPAALRFLPSGGYAGTAVFLALSAGGGLMAGMYYRKAVMTAWPSGGGAPAALFYSWDLMGGCAGALVAGTFLIPLSGVAWTAAFVASVHVSAAVLIAGRAVQKS